MAFDAISSTIDRLLGFGDFGVFTVAVFADAGEGTYASFVIPNTKWSFSVHVNKLQFY